MSFPLSRSLAIRILIVLVVALAAAGHSFPSAVADTSPLAGRVGGLVLDRNNQPMAGATVTLTDASGTVAGSADTDAQGRWSAFVGQGSYDLAVTAHQNGHTLSAKVRRYAVEADTKLNVILAGEPDVRVAAAAAVDPDAGTDGPASPAYTRAAAATAQSSSTHTVTFSGQVLDPDGDAVRSNVSIQLTGAVFADVIASEDDDGTFSLDVPAGTYSLRVETDDVDPYYCPGYCPDYRGERQAHSFFVNSFRLDGDRQETIRLPRPEVMNVTVVDPSNRPVPWAWVTSTSNWNEPLAIPLELFPGATVTDVSSDVDLRTGNDGTAAVEYFTGSGPATISVEPPAGTQLPTETAVPLNATSLTIQLQEGPTLHGRLLQADGSPLHIGIDGHISGDGGSYPVAVTPDGYAVTAPPGRYRMSLEVVHNEEGESSDYWIWELQTGDFDIVGD
ncbi:MAG: carboxypeptidase regulatory-like domain-containing protein, partial [Acidimicrobiia bacterium]